MTKREELILLNEINNLILSAGPDSYIADTFAGIVDLCRENIENDFGNRPVQDLADVRNLLYAEQRRHDETQKLLEEAQSIASKAIDERDNLRVRIREVEEERDAIAESVDGLGEIIDEQEKKIRMYETEIAQYARGDVVAEIRLDQIRRVVIIRGLYEKFIVGTQKHITENAVCPWDYMSNGWKWEENEYCADECEAKKHFAEIVIAERRKAVGK